MACFVVTGSAGVSAGRHACRNRNTICMVRAGTLRSQPQSRGAMGDMLDDLQQRKMGQGDKFYGERRSGKAVEQSEEAEELEVRENAVLVTGATGEVGVWIVLSLLNADIPVRILTRKPEQAENTFGLDGSNCDIFVGDLRNDDDVKEAVEGASAIVCASGSRSPLGANNFKAVDCDAVRRLVKHAEAEGIRKFVLMSCAVQNPLLWNALESKREGEAALTSSKLSHAIFRLGKTVNEPGDVKELSLGNSPTVGSISREDVGSVVTSLILADAEYTFAEDGADEISPRIPNFTANLCNSGRPAPDKVDWEELFTGLPGIPAT